MNLQAPASHAIPDFGIGMKRTFCPDARLFELGADWVIAMPPIPAPNAPPAGDS
jgi:hypothetical protein